MGRKQPIMIFLISLLISSLMLLMLCLSLKNLMVPLRKGGREGRGKKKKEKEENPWREVRKVQVQCPVKMKKMMSQEKIVTGDVRIAKGEGAVRRGFSGMKMENFLLSCLIFLSWKPLKSESEKRKIAPFGERREEIEKETRIRTALKHLSQMNQVMMMLKEKMENLLLSCLIFLSWEPLKSEKKKSAPFRKRREEIEKETRIRAALKHLSQMNQ